MKKKCSQEIQWIKQWGIVCEIKYKDKLVGWIKKNPGSHNGYSWFVKLAEDRWNRSFLVDSVKDAKMDVQSYICRDY